MDRPTEEQFVSEMSDSTLNELHDAVCNNKLLSPVLLPAPLEVAPDIDTSMLLISDFTAANTLHSQAPEYETTALPQVILGNDTTDAEYPFPQLAICLQRLESVNGDVEENFLKLTKCYALVLELSMRREQQRRNGSTQSLIPFITTVKATYHELESVISVRDHPMPIWRELDEEIFCSYEWQDFDLDLIRTTSQDFNGVTMKYLEAWAFQNIIDAQPHFEPLIAAIMAAQPLYVDLLGDGEARLYLPIGDTTRVHINFIQGITMVMQTFLESSDGPAIRGVLYWVFVLNLVCVELCQYSNGRLKEASCVMITEAVIQSFSIAMSSQLSKESLEVRQALSRINVRDTMWLLFLHARLSWKHCESFDTPLPSGSYVWITIASLIQIIMVNHPAH
jgi:hypothetical protein